MKVQHNGGFLILLGIASIFDGLVRVLTLGIICPSIGFSLQAWKVKKILQAIRENENTNTQGN